MHAERLLDHPLHCVESGRGSFTDSTTFTFTGSPEPRGRSRSRSWVAAMAVFNMAARSRRSAESMVRIFSHKKINIWLLFCIPPRGPERRASAGTYSGT
jgi:hypothetical protein